jgi:hypothetical protein
LPNTTLPPTGEEIASGEEPQAELAFQEFVSKCLADGDDDDEDFGPAPIAAQQR